MNSILTNRVRTWFLDGKTSTCSVLSPLSVTSEMAVYMVTIPLFVRYQSCHLHGK